MRIRNTMNQMINFSPNGEVGQVCGTAVPIVKSQLRGFYIYANESLENRSLDLQFFDMDDTDINPPRLDIEYQVVRETGVNAIYVEVEYLWGDYTGCCYLQAELTHPEKDSIVLRSNTLKIISEADEVNFCSLEYGCNEDEFGIPFSAFGGAKIRGTFPLLINAPQFRTNDEVYETVEGETIVLYSKLTKEYELETEYIPLAWHEVLSIALSCDHVSIDGISVVRSGEYSIDWDNKTINECGVEIARGSGKVKENFSLRNSN